jgi:hypothetical protein
MGGFWQTGVRGLPVVGIALAGPGGITVHTAGIGSN